MSLEKPCRPLRTFKCVLVGVLEQSKVLGRSKHCNFNIGSRCDVKATEFSRFGAEKKMFPLEAAGMDFNSSWLPVLN